MESFPNEVIESILKYTSISSRRTSRSVCSKWKSEMDRVGHSVVIDDREEGLLDFIRKIVIKEVNIKYMEGKDTNWMTLWLDEVKTLIFTGYVNPQFITKNLFKPNHWRHLKKLFFYGSSLISQPLTQPGKRMKINYSCFPSLKELHIVVPLGVTMQAVEQLSHAVSTKKLALPPGTEIEPTEHFEDLLDERAQKNVRYLLECITAPNLKTFFFSPGPHSDFDPGQLFKFVVKHGKTLEKLVCPCMTRDLDVTHEIRDLADKLRTFHSRMKSIFFCYRSDHLLTDDVWTMLFLVPTHLEELYINYFVLPISTLTPTLTTIFSNNFRTLKYVTIKSQYPEEGEGCQELNMELLSSANCLQVLRIVQTGNRRHVFYKFQKCTTCADCGREEGLTTVESDPTLTWQLKNINSLPRSLKVFETTFSTTEDFDGARFLKEMNQLEELKLKKIRRIGLMKQQRYVSEFIRRSRFHRKLNVIEIDFEFVKALVPDVGGTWDEIERMEEFDQSNKMLFQIMHPLAGLEKNTWWTLDSMYYGGMMPENQFAECFDFGFEIKGEEDKVSYMRNYFDAVAKGRTPFSIESVQPFDVDWAQNSYSVHGGPHEECWGCSRTPLRTILSSSTDYHKVYNKCGVDQGFSRIVLLVNKRVLAEKMKEMFMKRIRNALFPEDGDASSSASETEGDELEDEPDDEEWFDVSSSTSEAEGDEFDDDPEDEKCIEDAQEDEDDDLLSSELNELNLGNEENVESNPDFEDINPESQEQSQNALSSNTDELPVPVELDFEVEGPGNTSPSAVFTKTTRFILPAESMPVIIEL